MVRIPSFSMDSSFSGFYGRRLIVSIMPLIHIVQSRLYCVVQRAQKVSHSQIIKKCV